MDHPEVASTSSSQANTETETEEPPAKVRRVCGDDRDGETCPICLGSCSNSGDHTLVALKCGHLFGAKCVEQWFRTLSVMNHACPICKTTTTMQDVRQIKATSQIVIVRRACTQQLEVQRNTRKKSLPPDEQIARQSWSFALEKNLEVNKYRGCRVLTHNCKSCELYVSQKNIYYQNFEGYGIRKVSCVDCKLGEFVYLHREIIMDMTYSQVNKMLLSVGHSSAKVIDVEGGSIPSVSIQSETPLWSCSWDYLRSNIFYVGEVGGVIKQYDIRNSRTCLQRLEAAGPGDFSAVVSLCSTEYGLLSCQLNSCWLWVANQSQWKPISMPVMGPFMSLCYDYESNRALVYCKPISSGERSKLALCKLQASAASVPQGDSVSDTGINTNHPNWPLNVIVNTEQTFYGSTRCSTLMTRAAWVKAPGATWVAAYSESDSTLFLHGLDEAQTMSLPAAEPVLDVCSVQISGNTLLATLSDTRLTMYKAVPVPTTRDITITV